MNWYKKAQVKEAKEAKMTDDEFDEITKPKWIPVQSSFIDSVAYFEPLGMFDILMKDGREYSFKDVPESVYERFMNSPSKGRFFNDAIKHYTQQ